MIASILGPSGSDRRMFTLVAITILLMPAGCLLAKLTLDDLPLSEVFIIGCLGTALLMSLCVTIYGSVKMVIHGLSVEAKTSIPTQN